jgi:hypothetical protein
MVFVIISLTSFIQRICFIKYFDQGKGFSLLLRSSIFLCQCVTFLGWWTWPFLKAEQGADFRLHPVHAYELPAPANFTAASFEKKSTLP